LILDDATANLWILVDERGGRLTDGYDSTAVPPGVIPLYGSYGPFVPKPRTIRSAAQSPRLGITTDSRNWLASLNGGNVRAGWPRARRTASFITASYSTSGTRSTPQAPGAAVDGIFSYWNHDFSPAVLEPVPGAEVEAICWGKSDPTVIVYDIFESVYTTTTAPWGGFHVGCSPGYEYVEGYIYLRDNHIYAAGKYNAAAGSGFAGFDGAQLDVRAANSYAARVYLDLRTYIPIVYA
ncbi:MAG: hypothetical protein AAB327_02265, partial [Actinomycetota bacterium]